MKVRELVKLLLKENQEYEVEVIGEFNQKVTNPSGGAISRNPIGRVIGYDNLVAITREI